MPYSEAGVGYRPTDTSQAAAPAPHKLTQLRGWVLQAVTNIPRTCDEVSAALGLSPFSVRPRLTELRNAGKIKNSGQRRILDSGKKGIVWEVVR
jgi:hypothetical protein